MRSYHGAEKLRHGAWAQGLFCAYLCPQPLNIPDCFPPDRRRPTTGVTTPSARSSYYNADTADLEIGQEFEDAEAEEEAALELQRASYKRLDPADYGEEEEEEEQGDEAAETAKQEGVGKGKGKTGAKKRGRDGTSSNAGAQGEALRAMKSDLEQIALGDEGEVCLWPVADLPFVFVLCSWVVGSCSSRIMDTFLVSTIVACIHSKMHRARGCITDFLLPSLGIV